jgi:hypothetical protein
MINSQKPDPTFKQIYRYRVASQLWYHAARTHHFGIIQLGRSPVRTTLPK